RGELLWLRAVEELREAIAGERLDQRRDDAEAHRERERRAVVAVVAGAQHAVRVDARDREADRDVARERRMDREISPRRIEEHRERIDVDELAVDRGEAARRLHPRIRTDDEDARGGPRGRDGDPGEEVLRRRETVPSVEIETEEDRLEEERV